MASVRQRNGRWQARVTRQGFPSETRTFDTRGEALKWARSIENQIDLGSHVSTLGAGDILFGDVLKRYRDTVSPSKRGGKDEQIRIGMLLRHRLASYSMVNLTPDVIANFRDLRLTLVSAGTVIRDLALLSGIINHARGEWRIQTTNPCDLVRKPPTPLSRNRTLTEEQICRLLDALKPEGRRSPLMRPLVELALETAMRQGELLGLFWSDVNLKNQTAYLPMTKNGTYRTVPLSRRAIGILDALPRRDNVAVFPMTKAAVAAAFRKACQRAGIEDFHFHDLRHIATTRLAQKLPNVIELAAVTGHQTVQMLKRYYHPDAEVLAQKLG